MENRSCNFFSNNNGGSSTGGQSSTSTPWDFWQLGTTISSQFHLIQWNNNNTNQDLTIGQTSFNSTCPLNSFEVEKQVNEAEYYFHGKRGIQYSTDHNLMSFNLNLGKRNYVENNYERAQQGGGQVVGFVMNKRGRNYLPGGDGCLVGPSNSSSTVAAAAVPRCQVEGCHVALVSSKAYHRRHKVCEMHAKAPKVVVLGLQQRFCQQCSRFHSVSEFDESKRSCRKRLAGHNERRRKSLQDHYTNTRNPSQGRALSLLSSKNDSLISKSNLPARCSGSISELIAQSRTAKLSQQLILDKDWNHPMENLSNIQPKNLNLTHNRDHMVLETHGWGPMNDATGNLTLNLMHIQNSEFGLLPEEERQEEEGRQLQERWNSMARAHIS